MWLIYFQAHARLMARQEVSQQDSLIAIMLIDASMVDSGLLHCNPMLDTSTEDPEEDFRKRTAQLKSLLMV